MMRDEPMSLKMYLLEMGETLLVVVVVVVLNLISHDS